uniref:Leukocyte surface antigen CD53 n=1 Tax=Salmo salar TaxID=8030 RepID=B9EN15_SALSA|nr:Leukocyte surface antigen CD53 [Salmo salar]
MAVNKRIKYLLFLFNLLFWISGCIILGVSIYLKVSMNGNVKMDEEVSFDLLNITMDRIASCVSRSYTCIKRCSYLGFRSF